MEKCVRVFTTEHMYEKKNVLMERKSPFFSHPQPNKEA